MENWSWWGQTADFLIGREWRLTHIYIKLSTGSHTEEKYKEDRQRVSVASHIMLLGY